MQYRLDKYDNKLSTLGFGCMRFSKDGATINYNKAKEEIKLAFDLGVNYFDTAYIYPGSEKLIGQIFRELNIRDKIFIADKLPQYMLKSIKAVEKTFNEQLERLQTDYIDYYLMHMMTDFSQWEFLKSIGIIEWIKEKKKLGKIKQIGFSYHGNHDEFAKILDAYDWEFCQIQYNYLDEHTQAGKDGLNLAKSKNIPVIVMEGLRGGKLANLPKKALDELAKNSSYTAAELAFRWLLNQEGIAVVLSGMNSIDMIKENVCVFSDANIDSFSDDDYKLVETIKTIYKSSEKVPCTACNYCMKCPHGVDIPRIFYYYNLLFTEKAKNTRFEFMQNMALKKDAPLPSRCVACKKCESHCPQGIKIIQELKNADKALLPAHYKLGLFFAKKFMKL